MSFVVKRERYKLVTNNVITEHRSNPLPKREIRQNSRVASPHTKDMVEPRDPNTTREAAPSKIFHDTLRQPTDQDRYTRQTIKAATIADAVFFRIAPTMFCPNVFEASVTKPSTKLIAMAPQRNFWICLDQSALAKR